MSTPLHIDILEKLIYISKFLWLEDKMSIESAI